jgi:CBS domain-containing protein
MVEFWMMITLATTAGTVSGVMPAPPVYYTQELCQDAVKELMAKGQGDHMCVRARPLVTMDVQGGTSKGER